MCACAHDGTNLPTLNELGGQAAINAEAVRSEERNARVEVIDSALGDRPHEGLGLGAEVPARQCDVQVRVGSGVCENKDGVGQNLNSALAGEVLDDEGAGGAGLDHDPVVVVDHVRGGPGDALLLIDAIILAQVDVAEGGGACPSVGAHEVTLLIEDLQRGTHGDGRNPQVGGELGDTHLTLAGEAIQDVVRAFFCTSHVFTSQCIRDNLLSLSLSLRTE